MKIYFGASPGVHYGSGGNPDHKVNGLAVYLFVIGKKLL